MITNRFQSNLDKLEGLIKNELWSAPRAQYEWDEFGCNALLAVSGGMDSMCLADLYYHRLGFRPFAIAHCNFNLRGEESDGDEAMVRQWAQERGLVFHHKSFDTEGYAKKKGLSIEMAARELRYKWFAELCMKYKYAYVAVAHHADDNAETLMLNLLRGTGLKGVTGMKEISALPYAPEYEKLKLVRPLLSFTRKQIEGYVHGHSLPYRNDSTNASVEYRRNSIRHEVFPVFERMNPSYVRTLNRTMTYFTDIEEIVSRWCRCAAEDLLSYEADALVIDLEKLMKVEQWRYLLFYILEPLGFTSSVLASLEHLLLSERTISGKKFKSDVYTLITGRNQLRVLLTESLEKKDEEECVLIQEAGLYRLGNVNFIVELCPWSQDMPLHQPRGVLAFDASALKFPFICRKWRRGDWMIPLGMKGKKKISDFFADLKWNETDKQDAIIISRAEEGKMERRRVAGLLGVRMDAEYKITSETAYIIRIRKQ